jgi:DUF4097 and DUF4098 domain-containing protein YvlB
MILSLMSAAAFALSMAQQVDTVIPVRAGTRLQIENFNGETVVRTWDRSAIQIVADGDDRNRLDIRNLGSLLTVKTQSRYGAPRSVDYRITVPVRTDLSISGVYNDVTIDGVQGGISVETVNGGIEVRGGDGFVTLKSVEGEVSLTDAKGRVMLSSVNEDVVVTNVNGDISVETVNGEVRMERIVSSSVSATTVNGDILYDGTIQDGGQYSLNTHNGDIDLSLPVGANATVEVSTFNGEVDLPFPVAVSKMSRNRFTFVLGSGSGRLNLESFQGTIRLYRPGEPRQGGGGVRNREQERRDRHKERG